MLLKRAFVVSSVRWKHPVPQENGETFIAFCYAIKVSFFIHFYRKDLSLHKNPIDIYEKRRHK